MIGHVGLVIISVICFTRKFMIEPLSTLMHVAVVQPEVTYESSTALSEVTDGSSTALPEVTDGSSTTLPELTDRSSTALSEVTNGSSTALPEVSDGSSTALPSSRLVHDKQGLACDTKFSHWLCMLLFYIPDRFYCCQSG